MTCSIIAAISKNNVIGNKGRIPWDLPEDRLHFKTITMNHVVIFGRKSFEEIGKPLPGRFNIVISSTKNFEDQNLRTVKTLQEAFDFIRGLSPLNLEEVFICGGQQLYQEAINLADKLYLTKINATIEGDTFFPNFSEDDFNLVNQSEFHHQNGYEFYFLDFKRK